MWFSSLAQVVIDMDEPDDSDEYLTQCAKESKVFEINYVQKRNYPQRLGIAAEESADRLLVKWWERLTNSSNIYK